MLENPIFLSVRGDVLTKSRFFPRLLCQRFKYVKRFKVICGKAKIITFLPRRKQSSPHAKASCSPNREGNFVYVCIFLLSKEELEFVENDPPEFSILLTPLRVSLSRPLPPLDSLSTAADHVLKFEKPYFLLLENQKPLFPASLIGKPPFMQGRFHLRFCSLPIIFFYVVFNNGSDEVKSLSIIDLNNFGDQFGHAWSQL